MITSEQANEYPSQWIQNRARTMEVEHLSLTDFKVKPSEEGKQVRIVRFHPEYRTRRDMRYLPVGVQGPTEAPTLQGFLIECFAEKSYATCPANAKRRRCSHIEAVIRYLVNESMEESL
jgi:hypothetical protein